MKNWGRKKGAKRGKCLETKKKTQKFIPKQGDSKDLEKKKRPPERDRKSMGKRVRGRRDLPRKRVSMLSKGGGRSTGGNEALHWQSR